MTRKLSSLEALRPFCEKTAADMGLEFCEVLIEKEPQGRYLRFYVDKEGGLSLDDCERFHRAVQQRAEAVDYDFMEVCSPGLDRPVRTDRDIRKALGQRVCVRLYRAENGGKQFEGFLKAMDAEQVALDDGGETRVFGRKTVAMVRLVPDLSALEGDTEDIVIDSDVLPDESSDINT